MEQLREAENHAAGSIARQHWQADASCRGSDQGQSCPGFSFDKWPGFHRGSPFVANSCGRHGTHVRSGHAQLQAFEFVVGDVECVLPPAIKPRAVERVEPFAASSACSASSCAVVRTGRGAGGTYAAPVKVVICTGGGARAATAAAGAGCAVVMLMAGGAATALWGAANAAGGCSSAVTEARQGR